MTNETKMSPSSLNFCSFLQKSSSSKLVSRKRKRTADVAPLPDQRRRVLAKLVQQIRNTPKGEQRTLPINHLEVIATDVPHALLSTDPAIHWVSFLLRNQQAYLATRVLSTYLHRGIDISLDSMLSLCQDASKVNATSAAVTFAEHTCRMLSAHPERAVSVLNQLILTFYNQEKYDAVLKLASVVLQENGITVGSLQYRRVLQSIFKIYRISRTGKLKSHVMAVEALMSMLEDWIEARRREESHLDQYDIAILLQGLAPLLDKQHPRDYRLPRHLHSQVLSFITVLVQYVSSPVAKLSLAEVYLNSYEAVVKEEPKRRRTTGKESIIQATAPPYQDILAWSDNWIKVIKDENAPRKPVLEALGQLAGQARALKVITRDHINFHDDQIAFSHVEHIHAIQAQLTKRALRKQSAKSVPRNSSDALLLRQYAKDAQLRFTGTIIRICSIYLRTQKLGPLLVALSFTRHLTDLTTFTRIWKRSIHLSVQTAGGGWEGPTGLQAMLVLLSESIPTSWGHETVGELLFSEPSNLLEDSLYVALGSSMRVARGGGGISRGGGRREGGPATRTLTDRTDELLQLIHEKPQAYEEWERLMDPFTQSLRLPWRDALMKADIQNAEKGSGVGDASILLLKKMESKQGSRMR